MAGQDNSIPDGLMLVAVIVGWACAADWLAYRVPLASQLRVQGIDDLDEVEEVLLEDDGQLSVVRKDGEPPERPRPRQP